MPSKNGSDYWHSFNKELITRGNSVAEIWREEKMATLDSIAVGKEEGLRFLSQERDRIMRLSRMEAIREVLSNRNIEGKMSVIRSVGDNGILDLQ